MESEDYPFFQGLVYLLENDVSTLGYELTFSTEVLFISSRVVVMYVDTDTRTTCTCPVY